MLLDQFCPRQRPEITDLIVLRIDPIRADRDDYISMTGENLGKIIVSFVARNRLAADLRAWPLKKGRAAYVTGRVPAVEQYDHRIRSGKSCRVVNGRCELDRSGEICRG